MKNKSLVMIEIMVLIAFAVPVIYYFQLDFLNDKTVEIGIVIDGEYIETFPQKESGYRIQDITCDHGASGVWDDEKWSFSAINLTTSRTKCYIHFKGKYKEEILHGAEPVLKEGLIPVTISDNGTVQKANLYSEWYSYANQKWANAVILEDESITYQEGEEIPESNIESYFVWIPRYKYKLFNLGDYSGMTSLNENAVQIIDVVFGTDATNDANEGECTTPMATGNRGICKVGDYMTHTAFLSFDVNGIWVGKFETGYKGAASSAGAEKNENNPGKVQIKPNVYSWRKIKVSNAHLSSYNYKREYDSHMMKNTEWGAVAYLQHSVYGSHTSVRINNNSNYITGYAAKKEPTTGYTGTNIAGNIYEGTTLGKDGTNTYNYKNPLSVVASTTSNYTGVYDMSGGVHEQVMGVMLYSNNALCTGRETAHSGFIGVFCDSGKNNSTGVSFPTAKYYDKYVYGNDYSYYHRVVLGDAMGEMGPFAQVTYGSQKRSVGSWYRDEAYSTTTAVPWINRGNNYEGGVGAGVFTFSHSAGGTNGGFRVVLAFQ